MCDIKRSGAFLTADELVALRKPSDPAVMQTSVEKSYIPDNSWLEDKHLEALLEDHKSLLQTKRAARINAMVKAEWNSQQQKAYTDKLKGKFLQHMGKTEDGKISLSPEETIFLLEGGYLELLSNNCPMSTEEAYAAVLCGKLAHEKYLVYSHLSRLGFLVVKHQEKLDVTPYETKLNLDKHIVKKRHKSKQAKVPVKKNINFQGVLSKNQKIAKIGSSDSQRKSVGAQTADLNDNSNLAKAVQEKEGENSISVRTDNICSTENLLGNSNLTKITSECENADLDENSNLPEVVKESDNDDDDKTIIESNPNSELEKMSENASVECSTWETNLDSEPKNDSFCFQALLNEGSEAAVGIQDSNDSNIEINVIDSNSCSKYTEEKQEDIENAEESDLHKNSSCANTVESVADLTVANEKANQKEPDINVVDEESSNSDIYSVPSSDEYEDNGSEYEYDNSKDKNAGKYGSHQTDEELIVDPEVVFVEVKKTEKKPLAVIELSDEDDNDSSSNINETEDDNDVEIIGEFPSVSFRNSSSWKAIKCEKKYSETLASTAPAQNGFTWPFPNTIGKRVICLARPPSHLLPANVRLANEAYPIDLDMLRNDKPPGATTRVWESYKDLQARKRPRHHMNQQPEYRHGDQGAFNERSLSSRNTWNSDRNENLSFYSNSGKNIFPNFSNISASAGYASYGTKLGFNTQVASCRSFSPYQNNFPFAQSNAYVSMQFGQNLTPPLMSDNRRDRGQLYPSPSLTSNLFQMIDNIKQSTSVMSTPPPCQDQGPLYNNSGNCNRDIFSERRYQGNDTPLPGQNFHRNQQHGYGFSDFHPSDHNDQVQSYPRFHSRRGGYDNGRRRNNFNNFPSSIPKVSVPVNSWKDYKSSTLVVDPDEVQEIQPDADEILWSNEICPLLTPGLELSVSETLKKLQITKSADLVKGFNICEKYLPTSSSLEISFDVYLPGTVYRKSLCTVPNHRIIVLRAADPVPLLSDIVVLQKKFNDSAVLQFAVVDGGDISFYSFNHVNIPAFLPDS